MAIALVLFFFSEGSSTEKKEIREGNLRHLQQQLIRAAGVFVNSGEIVTKYDLEKTVFVTAANFGFLNHLLNFFCYVKRLNMKVLVVSLDKKLDDYLNSHNSSQIVSFHMQAEHGEGEVNSEAAQFRSSQFNLMTERKKEVVYDILKLGYNVMFADTDIALLEDPFPYLLWQNMDYVHSLNEPCSTDEKWAIFLEKADAEGNTGYYFIRSNHRTIKLLEDLLLEMDKKKELDDQSIFWNLMRNRKEPPVLFAGKCHDLDSKVDSFDEKTLRTCVLNPCEFSSGMMRGPARFKYLFENAKAQNHKVVTIHANWLNGARMKEDTMRNYGYWLTNSKTELGKCNDPPLHS
jgi:hypothetical protein